MTPNQVIRESKKVLQNFYDSRFTGLVFYGSLARNQATPESDIDLLVLLDTSFNYVQELRSIIELLYPIQLECDRLISAKPVALEHFEPGRISLYHNAKREGVSV